jgi:hypothetical protein
LIFKIQNGCSLYGQYISERLNDFKFNDHIKKFCQIYQCNKNELKFDIKPIGKKKLSLSIKFKDGRKTEEYDISDIKIENLSIVPREYHASNINKYLTKESKAALKSPLGYEYFMIENDLYIEIAEVTTPIEFKILGISQVDEAQEDEILHIRDMIDDLNLI